MKKSRGQKAGPCGAGVAAVDKIASLLSTHTPP